MISTRVAFFIVPAAALLVSARAQLVQDPDTSPAFGTAVAPVGDLDGDGWQDFLVGDDEYERTTPTGTAQAGAVYVYSGRTQQPLRRVDVPEPVGQTQRWIAAFGHSLSSYAHPDVTGGRAAVIGAPDYDNSLPFFSNGLVLVVDPDTGEVLHRMDPDIDFHYFGWSVAGLDDLNGDETGELLVGCSSGSTAGKAWLYDGMTGQRIDTIESPDPSPQGRSFGYSVAGVPDLTGDGTMDLAVGTHLARLDPKRGIVHLFDGTTRQLIRSITFPMTETGADSEDVNFGVRLLGMPDVTGDGRGDLLVSAPMARTLDTQTFLFRTGLVCLFDGATGDLSLPIWNPTLPSDANELDNLGGDLALIEETPLRLVAGGVPFTGDWEEAKGGAALVNQTGPTTFAQILTRLDFNRNGLGYSVGVIKTSSGSPLVLLGQPEVAGQVYVMDPATGETVLPPIEIFEGWALTGNP